MDLTRRKACLSLFLLSEFPPGHLNRRSLKSKTYRFEDLPSTRRKTSPTGHSGRPHAHRRATSRLTKLFWNRTPCRIRPIATWAKSCLVISTALWKSDRGKKHEAGPRVGFFCASNEEHQTCAMSGARLHSTSESPWVRGRIDGV